MKTFLLLSTCFLFFSCYDKNRIDSWEIQKRVGILIEAKAVQCGNRPPVPLFFTLDKPPGEVERCELDVIGLRCPFRNYPWSCVRIF